ncbi:MAG: NmrA family NAD(P)-binding protein [Candidatus Marsarchaeota archaeon]|nr:NmrA family NAD(P)-binding protein [Candidatus Marsarchaeota archaeon]MCL5101870.1 NmrA family NAD(P)-binding protein [Candidatus Marsarchaeota archaeon]
MNLFAKIAITTIAVVFVLGLVFAALLLVYHPGAKPITSAEAEGLVLKDMQQAYPNATFNVISVSKSNLTKDSWNIVLNVAYNYTRACPEVMTEGFDYPAVNLVPSDEILYSSNCELYGFGAAPDYIISNPYIAIVRAYDSDNSSIRNYIEEYGYNNTYVYANFYRNASPSLSSVGINSTDSWIISYKAANAKEELYARMSNNGSIIETVIANST